MLLILFLLIGLPLIELFVLIRVGAEIGALPTIALSILTAILGTILVRHQGLGVLMRVRELLDRGEPPALEMMDGALLLMAGFFLLLPGFLTDTVGFLLLIPPLRRGLIGRYLALCSLSIRPFEQPPGAPRERPRIIQGDYRRDD